MTPLERRNGFYNINKALYDANYAKFLKTCYLYAKIKIEKNTKLTSKPSIKFSDGKKSNYTKMFITPSRNYTYRN